MSREDEWIITDADIGSRVRAPKRLETTSTTVRAEMQRRDRARVYITAAPGQVIVNNVPSIINWDNEFFDEAGMHDNAVNNSRITCYQADVNAFAWHISANIQWDVNAAGDRRVEILKNGGAIAEDARRASVGIESATVISILVDQVLKGDYFEVRVLQSSGGNLNVLGSSNASSFFQAIALW